MPRDPSLFYPVLLAVATVAMLLLGVWGALVSINAEAESRRSNATGFVIFCVVVLCFLFYELSSLSHGPR